MRKDKHIISVVIPTLGRGTLNHCKKALQQQTRQPDEIIVIYDKKRKGASWARNQGIKKSKGDLIAFLDDDCIPQSNWLQDLVNAIDTFHAAGAGGNYQETDPILSGIRKQKKLPRKMQKDDRGLVATGGNIIYKKEWLLKLKRKDGFIFNQSFKYSQDWELAWRLRRLGALLVYVPVHVKHLRTLGSFSYLRFRFTRGMGIANLYAAQREVSTSITFHKSLLWDKKKKTGWVNILFKKIVGPFDRENFRNGKDFFLYWMGEKTLSLGFFWGVFRNSTLDKLEIR